MNNTERLIQFDRIKEIWMSYAVMDSTKDKILNAKPYLDETELRLNMKRTTEATNMLDKCGVPTMPSFSGVKEIIESAQKECCLTAEELERIGYALVAVRRLKDYLNRCKVFRWRIMKKSLWRVMS